MHIYTIQYVCIGRGGRGGLTVYVHILYEWQTKMQHFYLGRITKKEEGLAIKYSIYDICIDPIVLKVFRIQKNAFIKMCVCVLVFHGMTFFFKL